MAKLINCECGYVARGDTDEEVVDAIMAHMRSDHPNVYGRVARQDIFGWIEEAQPREATMAAPVTSTFDPIAYKATTQEQWQAAAEAWHRWGPTIEQWLGEATETMLDLAGVGEGAGTGRRRRGRWADADRGAACRPGRAGAGQRHRPRRSWTTPRPRPAEPGWPTWPPGLANVATRAMDGEQLDVDPGTYDAVISRVGLIYFPDQQRALSGMRRSLRPGGRVAAIVYSTPDRNQFFSLPVSIIRRRAQLPPFARGQPDPFSLGGPGVLEEAFTAAGFRDVVTRLVPAPLRLASASDCVRFERESFGALHQMLAGLDEPGREAAWTEIAEALAQFEGSSGFEGPCEMLVAAGTK